MNIALYQSAASLTALERWQGAVSQNIAASQVPGFKRRGVGFDTQLMGQTYPQAKGGAGDALPVYFPTARTALNFKQGEITPTSNDLDLALQGNGFFAVQKDDGSTVYTRSGALMVRNDRTLINTNGDPILNQNDTPIQLLPEGGKIMVDESGSIYQGDTLLGKLKVVDFANKGALVPVAGGYLAPGQAPVVVEKPEVMQRAIEGSNVSAMHEMVDLVTITRAYEANQKLIQNTDGMLQKALDKLG